MDAIEQVIKEIKGDKDVLNCKFYSANFLNNIADVFERHGFGVTKVFLNDKKERRELMQAQALQAVLRIMEKSDEIKQNRSIGRYIIKTLTTIKSMGV